MIQNKHDKAIQDLRPRIAEAQAKVLAAHEELSKRSAATHAANMALESTDPDNVSAWEKADANVRRAQQAERAAEQAVSSADAEVKTLRRALYLALLGTIDVSRLHAERLALLPKFLDAQAQLTAVVDECNAVVEEQLARREECALLGSELGIAGTPLVSTHDHWGAVKQELDRHVPRRQGRANGSLLVPC